MIRLPEKIRRTLERLVNGLQKKESVYGIGLFGSWSRGDAAPSSDVDLLIVDRDLIDEEFVERLVVGGLHVDLDHVPKKWICDVIPPGLDQKLYEMQILYDRDWSLTNSKMLMTKPYGSADRVQIRTEAHVVDSDIYLSRATSAFARGDYRSACLFASTATESVFRVLVEIAMVPFSNSHAMECLESSTTKLGMHDRFNRFLETSRLYAAESAKDKLKLFKTISNEFSATIKRRPHELKQAQFKVRSNLDYYLNPDFQHGMIMRTSALIDSDKMIEALHYMSGVIMEIIQNTVWLRSSTGKARVDSSILMRSLENLEEKNPRNYKQVVEFLNLDNVEKHDAAHAIKEARETMLVTRRNRKALIEKHLS